MSEKPASFSGRKLKLDYMMLLLCPLIIFAGVAIQLLERSGDAVRLYAYYALIVELLLCYIPARHFIDRQGGPQRFGLVRVSFLEWLYAAAMGVAAFYIFTALGAFLDVLLHALGMPEAVSTLAFEGGWRVFAAILLVGIVPAMAEETLFRGALLFTWLPGGRAKALWHSAALFALVQLQPQYFPLMLGLGLLFSHVTVKTGSIYPSVAMYAANNLMALMNVYLLQGVSAEAAPMVTADLIRAALLYFAMGATLGIVAYRGLLRAAKRRRAAAMEAAHKLYIAVRDALNKGFKRGGADEENGAPQEVPTDTLEESGGIPPYRPDARPLPFQKVIVPLTYIILGLINAFLLLVLFVPGLE